MLNMVARISRDIFHNQVSERPSSSSSQWESVYDSECAVNNAPDRVWFKSRTGSDVALVALVAGDEAGNERAVQQKANDLQRQGYLLFSLPPKGVPPRTGAVLPQNCYKAAVDSGRHTILVMKRIKIDQSLIESLKLL
jgi:hypothetical protein